MRRILVGLLALVGFAMPAAAQIGGGVYGPPTSAQIIAALGYTPANGINYCALAGCTMVGDFKFTDATYDIGKAGATRPRDLFYSRTGQGGTFALGGATIGTNALAVTGSANISGTLVTGAGGGLNIGFGGTTSSFPGLGRNGTTLQVELADTSAFAPLQALSLTLTGGQLNVSAMTQTSAAQSGTVCYNSGTGAVTYDATLGCLASSERFKTDIADIHRPDALALTMALAPVSFRKRKDAGGDVDPSYHVGFIAEQVAEVDERLVSRNEDGVRGVRYQEMSAIFAGAIQELNRKIIQLEAAR